MVFTAEVTVREAWSFIAKSIWGTVGHLTTLFKLVNGFRQNSLALCKVALINLILSSNGNPVNCTQDGGAELKETLGSGSWPTPPAVHSAVGIAMRGEKSRKLRAPPSQTPEQKPANDKGPGEEPTD